MPDKIGACPFCKGKMEKIHWQSTLGWCCQLDCVSSSLLDYFIPDNPEAIVAHERLSAMVGELAAYKHFAKAAIDLIQFHEQHRDPYSDEHDELADKYLDCLKTLPKPVEEKAKEDSNA